MATRFTFPPVNLGVPIEPQLTYRAEWVGYRLTRVEGDGKGLRWSLNRKGAQSFVFDTLCEVDMKLCAILEEIGTRIETAEWERVRACRQVAEQAAMQIEHQQLNA